MRPENKWNKTNTKEKRKRTARNRGKLPPVVGAATRSQKKAEAAPKRSESSPGPTDASSPANEDAATPENGNDNDNETGNDEDSQPPSKRRRANSVEPRRSTDTVKSRWEGNDAEEALRRAIQSSPARNNMANRPTIDTALTPKPVNRLLFPTSGDKASMRSIGESLGNSIRKSPRSVPNRSPNAVDKENCPPDSHNDNLDHLFYDDDTNAEVEPPSSPTPRRRRNAVPAPGSGKQPSHLSNMSPSAAAKEPGPTTKNEAHQPSSPTARLTAGELERPERVSLGMTASEYRLSNLLSDHVSPAPSGQNNSRKRRYDVIDGVVMDIFDSDDNVSVAPTESNYSLAPPKCPPRGSWADWIERGYTTPRETEEDPEERKKREADDVELFGMDPNSPGAGNSQTTPSKSLIDSFFANNSDLLDSSMPDRGFGPLIFEDSTAQPSMMASGHDELDQSILPDLDFFDPELVDPALMGLGEGGSGGDAASGGKTNTASVDEAALSAFIQGVNAHTSTTTS